MADVEPEMDAADLYALAVTLYEALSGKKPFEADSLPVLLLKIINEEPPPLRALCPDLPKRVEEFLLQGLEKKPERRFKSAEVMRVALGSPSRGRAHRPPHAKSVRPMPSDP